MNYLDVGDNFNPEVGFVQRRGVKTTKAYVSPTPRPGNSGIRMLEPMAVLTYITDQQNRLVGRTQHFMNGFYMRDGSFFNVIYQRDLDVVDAPFVVPQTHVTIPRRLLLVRRGDADLQHEARAARLRAVYLEPDAVCGVPKQGHFRSRRCAGRGHLASELSLTRNDAKLPFGNFVQNLSIPADRLRHVATHDDPEPDAVQLSRSRIK